MILASLETERDDLEERGLVLGRERGFELGDLSKWSSMVDLPRPVTMMISVQPAATASSTPYWIRGLSTRQHLLGGGLGGGEKASAQAGGGKDSFADLHQ